MSNRVSDHYSFAWRFINSPYICTPTTSHCGEIGLDSGVCGSCGYTGSRMRAIDPRLIAHPCGPASCCLYILLVSPTPLHISLWEGVHWGSTRYGFRVLGIQSKIAYEGGGAVKVCALNLVVHVSLRLLWSKKGICKGSPPPSNLCLDQPKLHCYENVAV